ncbi:MAG: ABC transporter ATP-binding protein [Ilumatobacteraceae bacterium]
MSTVELRRLTKRYDGEPVVRAIDLVFGDGELLVVVGPSGCGKTTVMRMVAGLESITDGDVLVDGVSVVGVHPRDRDLAMVFQAATLYPHLSVGENLGFPLKLAGVRRAEVTRRVNETAMMIGVHELLSRRPSQLSGGERQRIAMGRALIRRPQLLLMDEPMSNLDGKLRTELRGVIGHLQHRLRVTTMYVTHDQVEAMALGDRIAIMGRGRIVQCGRPERLYHRPVDAFVGSFIGSPPMNLMLGRLDASGRPPFVRIGSSTLPLSPSVGPLLRPHDGSDVIVGIRAQALHFTNSTGLDIDVNDVDQSSGRCVIGATVRAGAVVVDEHGVRIERRAAPVVLDLDGDDRLDLELWKRSTLTADPEDIHLFDPTTGRSLLADEPRQDTNETT